MKAANAAAEAKADTGTDRQKRHQKAVMVSVERHNNVVDTAVTLSHQGTDICNLADLSREQRDDVISLLQEMHATIFSVISCLREVRPSPSGPDDGEPEETEEPAPAAPAQVGIVSAIEEQKTQAPDPSLDIPGLLIQAARQRHPVASAPQDTPVPLTPPAPSPASPTPSPSPTPKLKITPHYLPAHRDPWPKDWRSLPATVLEEVIHATQAFGVTHRLEERHHRQLDKMRERLAVLRKADRAERSPTPADMRP
jgi:hypothetical protein